MSSSLWDVRNAEIKSLEYSDKDCIEYTSIKSKVSKSTEEIKYRYFYADFECDVRVIKYMFQLCVFVKNVEVRRMKSKSSGDHYVKKNYVNGYLIIV